jgi:hypothetical protein
MEKGDVAWIDLAQDRNRWRALVNSVLKLRVPCNAAKLCSGLTCGWPPRDNRTCGLSYSKFLYAPGAAFLRVPFPLPVEPYPVIEGV